MDARSQTAMGTSQQIKTGGKLYQGRRASLSLEVVVAGHKVTILEAAPTIGEIGAGIQVSPNLTRLLIRWGLGKRLEEVGVKPEGLNLRRWCTGETSWMDKEEYGAPYYHIHRADFHRMLYELAEPQVYHPHQLPGCFDGHVEHLLLLFESGEVVHADLVIGADGVKSTLRQYVVGGPDRARSTGDAAYRAIIPTEKLLQDPDLRPLVEKPEMVGWMGPHRHIMAYNIRAKREYNLVMIHPDDGSEESWTAKGNTDKMRAEFAGWEPRIQKLMAMIPSTLSWKLMDRDPLETWIHKDGKLVLLGDSCHPMLVEDAAVLGNLFSRLAHHSQILPLLHAYQSIRYDRATATQISSRLNQHIFHLPDGPQQEKRDREMRAATEDALRVAHGGKSTLSSAGNANQWADKEKSLIQFSYDADEEAEKWWRNHGHTLRGPRALL
ncbi:FAD/NAD(P)-binding domain-containing protein [Suillus occidentalis]|nr:FAD/NAD(P)-binding domain-containing protein [Suillus occidentalis]